VLFGHRTVETAQPSLDVTDRHLPGVGGYGTRQHGIRVPLDDHRLR
jgi:hypothetical protein